MVSIKLISHRPKSFDPPQQLIVEGEQILFDEMNDSYVEVLVRSRDSEDAYRIGDHEEYFDRGFVMNEAGNTISVIKKPSEL